MVDPQSRFHVIIYYIHIIIIYTSKCSPIQAKSVSTKRIVIFFFINKIKIHNIIVITEIIAFKLLKTINNKHIFTHYGFERINNSCYTESVHFDAFYMHIWCEEELKNIKKNYIPIFQSNKETKHKYYNCTISHSCAYYIHGCSVWHNAFKRYSNHKLMLHFGVFIKYCLPCTIFFSSSTII